MEEPVIVPPFIDVTLEEPQTASERWCHFVMKLVSCDRDLRTVAAWARHIGIGPAALRQSCRLVRVSPHDSRDFARMLRAICRSGDDWRPESVLNVADARTLQKLELRAGFDRVGRLPPSIEEFLENQTWVAHDSAAMSAFRTLWVTGPQTHRAPRESATRRAARRTDHAGTLLA